MKNKEHIKTLLKWLVDEVKSSAGDGDSAWYSRFYSLDDILPIVEEVNNEMGKWKWKIIKSEDQIQFGIDQEWLFITDSEEIFNRLPSWIQAKIRW